MMITLRSFLFITMLGGLLAGCSNEPKSANEKNMILQITSIAFSESQTIPQKYTCSGSDISPPLSWTQPPPGTKSIALICDDPDAPGGTWVHWVVYNLPPDTVALGENVETLPNGAKQGINDFKKSGYNGPCPPPGNPHRYFFKIYALDTQLNLPSGAMKKDLVAAMNNHVLAEGQLMGTFGR
jgi:Raf kinase inhibitor-like YbhB/YbcL family protein